jgi:hypothetical protein
MTNKQRNIAIFVSIGLVTVGYFIYRRKRNNEEANAIIEFINSSASQVDINEAANQGIETVRGTKFDSNKLYVDNLKGKYEGKIRDAVANIVINLNKSMSGLGTDDKLFFQTLVRIKNKNTLSFVDKVYKAMYKEGLFEAMKDETKLNNAAFALYSDKNKYDLIIPLLSESKWHPLLATYFSKLPLY